MPNKLLLAGVLALASAQPALAAHWLSCRAPDGAAEVNVLLGGDPGLGASAVTITVGERFYSTDAAYGEGETITLAQSFFSADHAAIDLRDDYVSEMVATLRLVSAGSADGFAEAGVLLVSGQGVWPVVCDEAE